MEKKQKKVEVKAEKAAKPAAKVEKEKIARNPKAETKVEAAPAKGKKDLHQEGGAPKPKRPKRKRSKAARKRKKSRLALISLPTKKLRR
jgi:hypothetical protein